MIQPASVSNGGMQKISAESPYELKVSEKKISQSGYHSATVYIEVGNISGLIYYSYILSTDPVLR